MSVGPVIEERRERGSASVREIYLMVVRSSGPVRIAMMMAPSGILSARQELTTPSDLYRAIFFPRSVSTQVIQLTLLIPPATLRVRTYGVCGIRRIETMRSAGPKETILKAGRASG